MELGRDSNKGAAFYATPPSFDTLTVTTPFSSHPATHQPQSCIGKSQKTYFIH
jgi:hypothetical protein